MDNNTILFIFIGIVVLVPIIPAFIFYKIIPTQRTDVEGSFSGLRFKLGGAFGGYFLVVFVLIMVFTGLIQDADKWQIWEIEGQVEFQGGEGSTNSMVICLNPPNFEPMGEKIKLKVLRRPGHAGEMEFPCITISHENFIPSYVEFSKQDDVDEEQRTIKVGKKIILKKEPQTNEINY
jgi:hypothetical protein